MTFFIKTAAVSVVVTLAALTGSVRAEEPKLIAEFKDWAVRAYNSKAGKVCFAVSQPKSSLPKGVNRDPVFFMITHRPAKKVKGEVSVFIGYPFKKDSPATVIVDAAKFTLITDGDGAWTTGPAEDRKLVAAMKKGAKLIIKGVSWRGTKTTDTFSLAGVTAAVDKIDELCP